MMNHHLAIFFVLSVCFNFVFTPAFAKKNNDPVVRASFFGTDGFHRKVLNTIQTSKKEDLNCKSSSFFSYYGFSQRCTSCATECSLDKPSKTCLDKCEAYLVYQMAVAEIEKRDEKIEHQYKLMIGGLAWMLIITLGLIAEVICRVRWTGYAEEKFQPRHPNHVTPEADRRPMTATKTERNRDDDSVGPESGFMSNHSADSQC